MNLSELKQNARTKDDKNALAKACRKAKVTNDDLCLLLEKQDGIARTWKIDAEKREPIELDGHIFNFSRPMLVFEPTGNNLSAEEKAKHTIIYKRPADNKWSMVDEQDNIKYFTGEKINWMNIYGKSELQNGVYSCKGASKFVSAYELPDEIFTCLDNLAKEIPVDYSLDHTNDRTK